MQIIQSLLGNQANNLGQKSYLGSHRQLFLQPKSTSLYNRHSNFITPLVISKPLVPPSRLFLAGKRQPFIDTLMTDNDLGSLDMDTDFPGMEMETDDFITPENSTNQITDINSNLGNISNIIQTQIANNLNNEILPEIPIPQKPKTTRKKTTQKTTTQKTPTAKSPKKSQSKTTTKKSTAKKAKQFINETSINNNFSETNLLIPENIQPEILNFNDNSPDIQAQINLDNTIQNRNESQIKSIDWEGNSTLPRQIINDEPQIIDELDDSASNLTNISNIGNNTDIQETEQVSTQNSEFNSNISNLSAYSNLENQSPNIGENENINTVSDFTNIQPRIDSETSQSTDISDILDIPVGETALQQNAETSNITQNITQTGNVRDIQRDINNIAAAPVDIVPAENPLYRDISLNTNPDNSSDSLPQKDQVVNEINNSNLAETKPLSSETITPKFADTITPSTQIDTTQQQTVFADLSSGENQTASVSEVTTSKINKNTIEIPQEINTANTANLIDDIDDSSELLSPSPNVNEQANLFTQSEETNTTTSNIITPDSLSLNISNNQESNIALTPEISSRITPSATNQIHRENTTSINAESITSDITEISPVITSPISSEISSEITTSATNQIQPKNATSTNAESITSDVTEISPVITSPISSEISSEITTSEINQIQRENATSTNAESITSDVTEISPVITSPISSEIPSEITTSEINQIQPKNTTSANPENVTSDVTEISPVITSRISSEINQIQRENTTSPNPENIISDVTATTPITTSPILPTSDQVDTPEQTIIIPDADDISSTNITDNLPNFRNIIDNEQPTISESSVGFANLNLSAFVNKTDRSESISPQDNENNEENSSKIDTELNNLLNNLPVPQGYATGGQVTTTSVENHHPVAPSDTVPAMLTPGEFVINAKDAQKHLGILKHINTGGSPEEIISPSLDASTTNTPETENVAASTTKVDSFVESTLQRKEAEPDPSSEPTGLTSPSLGLEIGKNRLSRLNSPQINTVENTTNTVRETAPHYSSPSLIFRKTNSTTNTQTPSQWSSIEELLNGSNDQFTNFNFSSGESNWQNSPSSQTASSSTPSNIFAQRFPTHQGFANGGEVAPPDISRDIAPVTETINSPYSSSPTGENNNNNESNQDNGENGDNKDDDAKLEALAQEIYYKLRQRIEIEKERQGKYVGRLPW